MPAGAGRALFTPWLSGERSPVDDRQARGGFHNLSLDADRDDLTRAVIEGVALNLRWLLAGSERFAGRRLDPIRLIGGAARNDLWCQILADVCDRSLERTRDPLVAGLRGCGLTFALASGAVTVSEVGDLVPVDRFFDPDPEHREIYDLLYAQFPKLHSRNRKMFVALN